MGRRAAGHVFMASKWVFPGGRIDPSDFRIEAAGELPKSSQALLARELPARKHPFGRHEHVAGGPAAHQHLGATARDPRHDQGRRILWPHARAGVRRVPQILRGVEGLAHFSIPLISAKAGIQFCPAWRPLFQDDRARDALIRCNTQSTGSPRSRG